MFFLGMVAANAIDGISPLADWNEVLQITRAATPPTDVCLLDVRTKAEFDKHALPHAINIPLNDLREHVDQLRAYKRVLAYCGVGQRSHNAVRILRNLNFDAYNISGAYTTYQLFTQNALYKPLQ
jgi:rhodanese-related sulfurtransferase